MWDSAAHGENGFKRPTPPQHHLVQLIHHATPGGLTQPMQITPEQDVILIDFIFPVARKSHFPLERQKWNKSFIVFVSRSNLVIGEVYFSSSYYRRRKKWKYNTFLSLPCLYGRPSVERLLSCLDSTLRFQISDPSTEPDVLYALLKMTGFLKHLVLSLFDFFFFLLHGQWRGLLASFAILFFVLHYPLRFYLVARLHV